MAMSPLQSADGSVHSLPEMTVGIVTETESANVVANVVAQGHQVIEAHVLHVVKLK